MWDSLPDDGSSDVSDLSTPEDYLCLAISKAAVSGAPAPRTVQFLESIQGLPLTILIDSGSTSSFISETLAKQLSSQTFHSHSTNVSVA